MDVSIIPATLEHARRLAPALRDADKAEIKAASHLSSYEALEYGVRFSTLSRTVFMDGQIACMWGVGSANLIGGVGVPWMLGSPLIKTHAASFLRRCGPCVEQLKAGFQLLENYVDARNTAAIRWLRWLGFCVEPPHPFGPDGLPFHRFWMEVS